MRSLLVILLLSACDSGEPAESPDPHPIASCCRMAACGDVSWVGNEKRGECVCRTCEGLSLRWSWSVQGADLATDPLCGEETLEVWQGTEAPAMRHVDHAPCR